MLIGELVQKTGFSRDTIRFYEKMGLIIVPRKARRENNYKEYPDNLVNKLLVMKQLKEFGFTLTEIADLISLYEADLPVCSENIPKIKEKIRLIDEKIKQLKSVKQQLIQCMKNCPDACKIEETLGKLN